MPRRRHEARYRVTRERLEGYAEALGAGWDDVPLYETFPNSRAAGARAARALLALEPRPTALLAMSDELALGALDVARELELDVPRELSVVGYDDVPAAAAAALTTVRQPLVGEGPGRGADAARGARRRHPRRRRAPDRARGARLDRSRP